MTLCTYHLPHVMLCTYTLPKISPTPHVCSLVQTQLYSFLKQIKKKKKKIKGKILSHVKLCTYHTTQDQSYTPLPCVLFLPKNNYYPKQLTLPKLSFFPLSSYFSSLTFPCAQVFSPLIFPNTILPFFFFL
jgi:hypothetical protein